MRYKRKKYSYPKKAGWKDAGYLLLFILIFSGIISGIASNIQYLHTPVAKAEKEIAPTPTPQSDKWSEFIKAVHKVAPMFNFPEKVVIAQCAHESAHGTSEFAQLRNNFCGIGAFTDTPDMAYSYENAEQCVIDYMITIRSNFPEAWASRNNPEQLLNLLENNSWGLMYATDTSYVSEVMSMPEWSK
jgi:flagellum-specific peptidoglycan hydrolase FlgJ